MKQPSPPLFGRALLWLCLPEREMESIPGDLLEEFARVADSPAGVRRARRWYVRQAVTSAFPILSMRIGQGETALLPVVIIFAFLLPIGALEELRSYVLSSVPLKASAVPSTEFLMLALAVGFAVSAAAGFVAAGREPRAVLRSACTGSIVAACMGPAAYLMANVNHPAWFVFFLILCGPLGVAAGSGMRCLISPPAHRDEVKTSGGLE